MRSKQPSIFVCTAHAHAQVELSGPTQDGALHALGGVEGAIQMAARVHAELEHQVCVAV